MGSVGDREALFKTMILGPPKVFSPNRTSIHTFVFAVRNHVRDKLADTSRYENICHNSPALMHAMRLGNVKLTCF